MSPPEKEFQLEGIVQSSRSRSNSGAVGKAFLGVMIKCDDGKNWVVSYDEHCPFHAFADRRVVVSGESFAPTGQFLMGVENRKPGHFKVSTLRLVEVTPDAELVAVGPEYRLSGRFERDEGDTKGSGLSFVTEQGETCLVTNDPPGATFGSTVEVWAYPVQRPPTIPICPRKYLWIRCNCSTKDEWEHRVRSHIVRFARDGSLGPMDESLLREFQRYIREASPGNFLRLREVFAASRNYEPYGAKPADARGFLACGDFAQARALLLALMPGYLLNPGIHTLMASARQGLGDEVGAWVESDLAKRCLAGIRSTGAGSRKRPYLVLQPDDEFDVLDSYSKKSTGQALFLDGNQAYRRHDCEDGDPVWFDVTIPHAALTRQVENNTDAISGQ